MWALQNQTSFAAAYSWTRDREGAETWIVVVRGTFAIQANGTLLALEKQDDVCETPVYRGDPATSSLVSESDFQPIKTATDILVNGQGYAPGGRPRDVVDVSISVGKFSKVLRVFGDRR